MNINPFDILKNAQKIQAEMGSMQEKLALVQVTGVAGGGMVEIDLNGRMEMLAVRIAPEVLTDVQMAQDLVLAAYASASEKVKDSVKNEMGSFAAGLGIPT
jgi:DNA-binding YbaB/EbfC family protein